MENQNLLQQVYNLLLTIETKGENTLKMSECIRALDFYIQSQTQVPTAVAPEEKEEE